MNCYEFGGFDNSIPDFYFITYWSDFLREFASHFFKTFPVDHSKRESLFGFLKTAHVNLITFVDKMSHHPSNLITLLFLHIYL